MLTLKNISYSIDDRNIFSNVNFSINKNDRIGLIGDNGAGKTTLLKIIAGQIKQNQGVVIKKDISVKLMPQNLESFLNLTVYDFFEHISGKGKLKHNLEQSFDEMEKNPSLENISNYNEMLDIYNRNDVENFDNSVQAAIQKMSFSAEDLNKKLSEFSGGQRARISIAAISLTAQDIFLLDEPTNNLDHSGINELEKFIDNSNSSFVIVTHDRNLLRKKCTKIIELVGGNNGVNVFNQGYDEYVKNRDKIREANIKKYELHQDNIDKLNNAAKSLQNKANNLLKKMPKTKDNEKLARNARSEKSSKTLNKAYKSIKSRISHSIEIEKPKDLASLKIDITNPTKRTTLLTVKDLSVIYPSGFRVGPLNLYLKSGDRIEINGSNGSGKTSLIKGIMGHDLLKLEGNSRIGTQNFVYINQDQELPLMSNTALDNIRFMSPQLPEHDAINLLLKFNLNKNVVQAVKAMDLSGGERAKVLLASISANDSDLILMDEPTNNLDIISIEAIEKALSEYTGGMLVISHDKEFLKNLNINKVVYL